MGQVRGQVSPQPHDVDPLAADRPLISYDLQHKGSNYHMHRTGQIPIPHDLDRRQISDIFIHIYDLQKKDRAVGYTGEVRSQLS